VVLIVVRLRVVPRMATWPALTPWASRGIAVPSGRWTRNVHSATKSKQRAERQLWTCPDGYLRYGTQDPLRCLASRYTTLHRQQLRVSAETGRMGGPDRTGSPVARRVSGGL